MALLAGLFKKLDRPVFVSAHAAAAGVHRRQPAAGAGNTVLAGELIQLHGGGEIHCYAPSLFV